MEKEYAVMVQFEGKGEWFVHCLEECLEKAEQSARDNEFVCKTQYTNFPRIKKNKYRAGVREVSPWKINDRKVRGTVDDYRRMLSESCRINKRYPNSKYMAGCFKAIYDMVKDCLKEWEDKELKLTPHSFENKCYKSLLYFKAICLNALAFGRMTCSDTYSEGNDNANYLKYEKEEQARLELPAAVWEEKVGEE